MTLTDDQILNFLSRIVLPSALAAGGQYLRKKLVKDSKDELDILGEVGAIISQMQDVVDGTSVERFLIFRADNEKQPTTTGVILEVFRSPIVSVYESYQELEFDDEYSEMIAKIRQDKSVVVITEALPDESLLKRIYLAENIKHACVFLLLDTKKYLFYASVATTNDSPFLTAIGKNKVELAKGRIRAILTKYREQIGD